MRAGGDENGGKDDHDDSIVGSSHLSPLDARGVRSPAAMFVVNLFHPVSGLTSQIFLNGLERFVY